MKDYTMTDACKEGLRKYISFGLPPGGFLTAVLENDLVGAVRGADSHNIDNIPAYVSFLYWEAPMDCWGSKERVKNWIAKGGLHGQNDPE
jgi:hypothetical protein